jgi:uncharacterized RDD family membrane protein YckC
MKTCTRCGLASPDSAERCECGATVVPGDRPRPGRVAGFWIRFASDLLDALVLGLFGMLLVAAFRHPLSRLGERGVLLGIPISLLYTAVLQSRIGGGQTLAKRLLGLRVVRLDGSLLSLDRSIVRWAVIGFLFYGGAAVYALGTLAPGLHVPSFSAAIVGVQVSLFLGCGLLLPFHPLKRGLHDLLTGSMVVRGGALPAELIARAHDPRRDRRLVIAAGVVAILAAASSSVASRQLPIRFGSALRVAAAMRAMGIQNPVVNETTVTGTGGRRRMIIATGFVPTRADGTPAVDNAHQRILGVIRKEIPLDDVDTIGTTLRTGINIGIYSSYQTSSSFEPSHGAAP